jgi:hypothetical protein
MTVATALLSTASDDKVIRCTLINRTQETPYVMVMVPVIGDFARSDRDPS